MFDSTEELLQKIRVGKDTSLEYKAVYFRGQEVYEPKCDDLADEIAAIANTREGVLVLGIDDKTRDILGIPIERLDAVERFVFEICTDSIKPPVVFRSFRVELPDSAGSMRAVLKVEVPRSLFIHKSPGGYFFRQGSSKREMPTDLLLRLGQQRSQARLIRFDEQAVPKTSLLDMDETLWRRFSGKNSETETMTLHKMSLLTKDEEGSERATVAGILLCSRSPERWLSGAFIQAVCYRGIRQDSNYQIDAQDITGPLDAQIRAALTFVHRNMWIVAAKDPARVEVSQYSVRAVFEAVVNAVAHRDYSVHGSKIRLFLFDDRMEIYSPGPLPNTITIESIALRQLTRNELVTSLLAKCAVEDPSGKVGRRFYMEKRGDGVPIILHESEALSGKCPVYRLLDDSELLLTLFSARKK